MAELKYWLFKSEPTAYSFTDLMGEQDRTAEWDGVRNYQARNFLRDDVEKGDKVLFYHSSADPTAVVGFTKNHLPWLFSKYTRAARGSSVRASTIRPTIVALCGLAGPHKPNARVKTK